LATLVARELSGPVMPVIGMASIGMMVDSELRLVPCAVGSARQFRQDVFLDDRPRVDRGHGLVFDAAVFDEPKVW